MSNGFNATDFTDAEVPFLTEGVVSDPDLGISGQKPYMAIMGGPGSTHKLVVNADGSINVIDENSVAIGTIADAAVVNPGSNASVIALLKGLLTQLGAGLPAALDGSGGLKTALAAALPAGTNVLGHVIVDSGPPASRLTDSISAALSFDAIMNGLTALTPQYAPIAASASGVTTVVAAVASKKIIPVGVIVVANAAVSVNFQSHTTTATKTGTFPLAANGGLVAFAPVGWIATVAGEALDINLGSAVTVGGQLIYVTA